MATKTRLDVLNTQHTQDSRRMNIQHENIDIIQLPPLLFWLSNRLDVKIATVDLELGKNDGLRAYSANLSRYRLRLGIYAPFIVIPIELSQKWPVADIKRLIDDVVRQQQWHDKLFVLMDQMLQIYG